METNPQTGTQQPSTTTTTTSPGTSVPKPGDESSGVGNVPDKNDR